jgi:hypothetical protein
MRLLRVDDRRAVFRRGLDQFSPTVRPAECQRQRLTTLAIRLGQTRIATVSIDLDRAIEAGQDFIGIFALACRALDRQLELQLRNCLHHLRRQVWELAQIKGLRHGSCYPTPDEEPKKPENRP